jgi:serine phosphatase RsbU (regulator of sigma subunit)
MKIRTQLIIASFFLAVLPLAAIVGYSYHSSRKALESAYRGESQRATRQMDRRLASIRNDLDQRLALVSNLPAKQQEDIGANQPFVAKMVTAMGDSATFVDALEFQPVAPAAPVPPVAPPEAPQKIVIVDGHADAVPAVAERETPDFEVEPVIIDLPTPPRIPMHTISREHRILIRKIGELGSRLGNTALTEEQRKEIHDQMRAVQVEMDRVVGEDSREYASEVEAAQRDYQIDVDALQKEARERRDAQQLAAQDRTRPHPAPAPPAPVAVTAGAAAAAAPKPHTEVRIRTLTEAEKQKVRDAAKRTTLIFGRDFNAPVKKQGAVVGKVTAQVSPEEVIQRVLGAAAQDDDKSEIPFAVDREGNVYTRTPDDKARLLALGIPKRVHDIEGWIVTTTTDAQSGLRIGVARQVGDNLGGLRATAARNFGLGMGLIAFALIGIVPLASHLTRDIQTVSAGAERIAQGDLMTRVPVRSRNEFGQLAHAFNRMAEDLSTNQQKLLEQERARKEQELQQKLLAVEYERKTIELEDARAFQLSMLPKELPQHDAYDVAVFTRTATEVGGDYYDFHADGDVLSVAIGDATGHGAKAGTMVTVVKTLFAGYEAATEPAAFLGDAAEKIKRMELGRMSMALSIARLDGLRATVASAGMPPVLVHRASDGTVDEVAHAATPLGSFDSTYQQAGFALEPGDTVLFMTDGFPELMNDEGEQLGYTAATEAFAAAAAAPDAERVIARLASFAETWHGDTAPNDDVTFVVVRMRV